MKKGRRHPAESKMIANADENLSLPLVNDNYIDVIKGCLITFYMLSRADMIKDK
jgi:hypothetical protein